MTLARRIAPILEMNAQGELLTQYRRGGMDVRFVESVGTYHVQDGADEIWLRLRGPDARGAGGLFEPLKGLARRVAVPLVAWGAIRSLADARLLVGLGAERVVLDFDELRNPEPGALIEQLARALGPARISVALTTRRMLKGGRIGWELCSASGESLGHDAIATTVRLANQGAGEIIVQPYYQGLAAPDVVVHDAELVDTLMNVLVVQLVSVGEDREATDMVTPLLMGADGIASARLFAEGNVSIADAKQTLAGFGIPLRAPNPPYAAPR